MSPPSQSQASLGLARLVQRARGGSAREFEDALGACRQCLIEIAQKELGSSENDACHLADCVLEEVRELLPQFADDSEAELRQWLRAILLDETYQQRPREEGARPMLDPSLASTPEPGSVESQATPAGLADNRTLWRALTKLPPDAFKIIHRRHRLRSSLEEIASVLGVSTEAARRLYIRALALFAQELFEGNLFQGECKPIPPLWQEACRQVIDAGPAAMRMGPEDVEPGQFPYFENVLRCIRSLANAWPEVEQAPRTIDPDSLPGGRTGALPEVEGFQVHEKIGGGGQGVVYRAYHTRLDCWVALKFLQSAYARDPERLRRLRQEAQIAARLNQHGVLQIRDILEVNGTLAIVMPYVEGCSLAHIVGQRWKLSRGREIKEKLHPWASLSEREYADRLLLIFDKAIDALAGLHREGVLHRDLKPSNILVDKNDTCWLIDFGLARQIEGGLTTESGVAKGTQGFMSPEQWEAANDIDERTDIFGIGATIYQALTLEFPYGLGPITADQDPVKLPLKHKRHLPLFLDRVLEKALEPDLAKRYQTSAELREDWQRVRTGRLPKKVEVSRVQRIVHPLRRHAGWVAAALAIVAAGVLTVILAKPSGPVVRTVHIATNPPGATVALVPLREDNGIPQFDKTFLCEAKGEEATFPRVPPGEYLVIAEVKGHGFHEVFRRVPQRGEGTPTLFPDLTYSHCYFEERPDQSVELSMVQIPKSEVCDGMSPFAGGVFMMGSPDLPPIHAPHMRSVEPFYLDTAEVTVAEYRKEIGGIPRELELLSPSPTEAVRFVTLDQAIRYAERVGKRIPDEAEYEYAATNGGKQRYPWGDRDFASVFLVASMLRSFAPLVDSQKEYPRFISWPIAQHPPFDYDRTATDPQVRGLFSDVAEWTTSWYAPYPPFESDWSSSNYAKFHDARVVRGGPFCVLQGDPKPQSRDSKQRWDPRFRLGIARELAYPGLGFRCARSQHARFPKKPL